MVTFLAALLLSPDHAQAVDPEPGERPNVLLILADDLGYSDLGCYGGEIETPNLDGLAARGLRFAQFYNTGRCWPTRAAILTGYYAQQVRRDKLPGLRSGARGVRPQWARLLPDMLRVCGYRSYHSGKWHIDGMPLQNGFDRSYYLRDQGRFFNPRGHWEDDRKLPPVEPDTGYYGTTAIADHAVRILKEHAEKHAGEPFFHYLAFTAPHFPLHALPADIARYRDKYRRGWELARKDRWRRQKEMGIVHGKLSAVERDIGPPYDFPDALEKLGSGEVNRPRLWSELTDRQREFQSTKMAIHAAMIDRVDREIGRVLDQLRAMGAFDNTLILFLSDNGASAEIMVRDDGHDPTADPGSAKTYLCLGPGWSTSSNTPFRRHKTWVHEGGIATPLIVHWPRGITAKGEIRRSPGHVIDLVPTILEVAGGKRFETWNRQPVPPPPGKSLVPAFTRDANVSRDSLWWLHEGNRALRVGDWKLVAAGEKGPWELYNLGDDRSETQNLASKHPERLRELELTWNRHLTTFHELASRDVESRPANRRSATVKKLPTVKTLILPGESFLVAGRPAFVMLPPQEKRSSPQPWIFYAPTLPPYPDSHEKWMHERFLDAGVAVAGIDVGESHGSPEGRELFTVFHREMTHRRGYAPRPCLLGRSRGGLMVSGWAIAHPDWVAGIAGIYPVFDVRTYPGLGRAAPAYGMTPAELEARLPELNPIEGIAALARARVPAFIIHDDSDRVVPLEANSGAFVRHYESAGAKSAVQLIVAKDQGHNYWEGFFRSEELVEFAIARARAGARN